MTYDLLGLGLGPFNLSLAALMGKAKKTSLFLDQKSEFQWHPGLMFEDATMQNSWLKDLVTPADPTNAMSFLNFLVERGLFYAFVNTGRSAITRKEFESYCRWVSGKLEDKIRFNTTVKEVNFDKGAFVIRTDKETYQSKNLSLATGLVPRIPEFAKPFLGDNIFHAATGKLSTFKAEGKRILVVGGGQTGIEVFRNCLHGKWGKPSALKLLTPRPNLQPLDESPFSNEYFTPEYVRSFYHLNKELKEEVVNSQKLASDGNTPTYLQLLYNDLYLRRFDDLKTPELKVYTTRRMTKLTQEKNHYVITTGHELTKKEEHFEADAVIFCTGFQSVIPSFLDPLKPSIPVDNKGRLLMGANFEVQWEQSSTNHLFAMNFGRHQLGIAEPQTSLMAWRSATIINRLCGENIYQQNERSDGVLDHGH
ncbi:MAG: SidA/IucD/PvdA family monooxygenase [Bdellovibrionota bacterium]